MRISDWSSDGCSSDLATLQERLEPLLQDRCGRRMPPALESEVLLARQRRVALDRLVEDLLGLGCAAPAVELDPLALLQVLVVLEEVADALEPVDRKSTRLNSSH